MRNDDPPRFCFTNLILTSSAFDGAVVIRYFLVVGLFGVGFFTLFLGALLARLACACAFVVFAIVFFHVTGA